MPDRHNLFLLLEVGNDKRQHFWVSLLEHIVRQLEQCAIPSAMIPELALCKIIVCHRPINANDGFQYLRTKLYGETQNNRVCAKASVVSLWVCAEASVIKLKFYHNGLAEYVHFNVF